MEEYFKGLKIGKKDRQYINLQLDKMVLKVDDSCIDNFRVCKSIDGETSKEYEEQRQDGCCGSWDEEITNSGTGNSFWMGCNYGH